ncbi:MAG: hypothetical protein CM15mP33_02530 [Candidatus Neomarinimicrobiota bacterium]|jgi:hypothetical protein|nr:MAG: hypothetical protein CM15mP33_02530 [Candidatus Neomarinimicrobiota bacterium]|tara:strand:- start:1131 stop:1733 length:603 start_codon:yes stop_codon:yes gene_type:complete
MRNNLLVTILFLASSSIILSQDLRIKNLQIESKNNGTVIQLDSNKKVNLENVTAWYSSEWFYMTIYDANADSLSLANYKNDSLKNIEVSNSDESTQIAVQLFSEIESFEINTPNRKTLQFFLRNSQLVAKNSISVEDEIDIVQTEEKTPKEKDIIYEKEQPRNANNKLIVIAGLIVSAIDITNSTSFSAGALIAIIANFL